MLDALTLNGQTALGAVLAVLVFGGIRFIDDVVDVLASLDGQSAAERAEELDSSNT